LYNRTSALATGLNIIAVDGNRLAAGVYTIIIHSDGQKVARKIIKL
jgi:lactam utilization protein B